MSSSEEALISHKGLIGRRYIGAQAMRSSPEEAVASPEEDLCTQLEEAIPKLSGARVAFFLSHAILLNILDILYPSRFKPSTTASCHQPLLSLLSLWCSFLKDQLSAWF
jgi:hypothetical protein